MINAAFNVCVLNLKQLEKSKVFKEHFDLILIEVGFETYSVCNVFHYKSKEKEKNFFYGNLCVSLINLWD